MRSGVTLSMIADADSFLSASGSRIRTLYSPVVEGNSWHLVESGKQDIQDLIDSYRDLTDMSFIMSRLAAGDSSVINVPNAGYGDASVFPADPASLLNVIQNAQNMYDRLPDNVRSQFGSFRDWFSTSGTPEWSSKMQGKFQNSPNNVSAATMDPSAVISHEPVSNPISAGTPASEV